MKERELLMSSVVSLIVAYVVGLYTACVVTKKAGGER
jgi:hypothetical protein